MICLMRDHGISGKHKKRLITCGLIVVNVDPLQLKIRVAMVCACWVDAVFVRDDFPELRKEEITLINQFPVNY